MFSLFLFLFMQNAGGVIGKGGETIKRLRVEVSTGRFYSCLFIFGMGKERGGGCSFQWLKDNPTFW